MPESDASWPAELEQGPGLDDAQEDYGSPGDETSPEAGYVALGALAIGAAVYAVAALVRRRRRRLEEQVDAGNAALAMLMAQRDALLAVEGAFHAGGRLPIPEPSSFDPGKLPLLMEAAGAPAAVRLIEAQRRHERLRRLVQEPAGEALQNALVSDRGFCEESLCRLRVELVRRYGDRFIRIDRRSPPGGRDPTPG